MLVIQLGRDWEFYCMVGALALYHSASLVDCIAWCGHKGLKYTIREV
jgi:hypothetical protein